MNHVILKGWHYSLPPIIRPQIFLKRNKIRSWECKFSNECYYEKENQDSYDLNKLVGFSYGFNHHKNSIRIAWRPNYSIPGVIKIYAYTYEKGFRGKSIFLCDINVGEYFNVKIDHSTGIHDDPKIASVTVVTGERLIIKRVPYNPKRKLFGFRLNPYFGGDNVSPNKMVIYIKKLK